MRTYTPKASEIQRAWYVIDAEGLVLGRVATEAARRRQVADPPGVRWRVRSAMPTPNRPTLHAS